MNTPSDLNEIQKRSTQVWNCDEIMFNPNGRWNKVVFTYKFLQVIECGSCKQESENHPGVHYLASPNPMENAWCIPSLCTNQISTPKISTSISHWKGYSVTNHPGIKIRMVKLNPWTNYPPYAAPPLSKISLCLIVWICTRVGITTEIISHISSLCWS